MAHKLFFEVEVEDDNEEREIEICWRLQTTFIQTCDYLDFVPTNHIATSKITKLYRTKSGRVLTDDDIEALSDEAERGYDVDRLSRKGETSNDV